jgi:ATP-dependent RNA helicase MRH4
MLSIIAIALTSRAGPQFQEETQGIIDSIKERRDELSLPAPSVILSTATVPPSLLSHVKTHMPDIQKLMSPTLHRLPSKLKTNFVPWSGSGNKLADVAHEVKRMFAADAAERRMIEDTQGQKPTKAKMLIFCNAPYKVKALQKVLSDKGVPNHAISGDTEERIRGSNGVLDQFLLKPGQPESTSASTDDPAKYPRVLITTSLLSRGLDFAPSVKHVLLIDEPRDILDFMHRAGRTGRAGQQGTVTIFGSGASGNYGRSAAQAEGLKRWKTGTKLGQELKQISKRKAFA